MSSLKALSRAGVLFLGLAASCSDATSPEKLVVQVTVSPASTLAFTNQTIQLTARASDAAGNALPDVVFSWQTSDSSVATVSTAGLVQPRGKRGAVSISARSGNGTSGQATIALTPPPAGLTVVGGTNQTGTVGQPLAQPVVVELKASDNLPVAGVPVTFSAPAGASANPATAITDAQGRASAAVTLGTTIGSQTFSVSGGGLSASVAATATPDAPTTLSIVSGDVQADTVHKPLAAPLVVKVTDRYGNGVPSIAVTWRRAGSGSLSTASTGTGADGTSSVTYTLGATAGTDAITATVLGITPVNFSVRALAAAADAIVIADGNNQSAAINTNFATPLVVQAVDARGFGVAGATVTWNGTNAVPSSASTTTDDAGRSSITVRAGGTIGAASVTASVGGRSLTFTLNAAAGTPTALVFRVQPSTAVAGRMIVPALQVALVDAFGNLTTSGASVSLSIAAGSGPGGAALGGTTTRAAVNGIATFDDISIDRAGTAYRLVASSGSLPNATSAAFNTTEAPVVVSLISITQSSCPGGVCSTFPANLSNAADQLNVTFSVDGPIVGSAVILRCGTDSVVTAQGAYFSRTSVRARGAAAASVTVQTMPLNTAAYNATTGAVSLRNGTCTLRATAKPASAQSQLLDQTASLALTLNNADVVIGRVSVPRSSAGGTPFFGGGDVTVSALPVLYSGRTPTSATIGLALAAGGRSSGTLPTPITASSAPFSVTFPATVGAAHSIADLTVLGLTETLDLVLSSGSSISGFSSITVNATSNGASASGTGWNLDTQRPLSGVLPLAMNPVQPAYSIASRDGGYVGSGFVFAASTAAGFCGANATSLTPANSGTANPVCASDASQLANLDSRGGIAGSGGVTVRFQAASAVAGPFTDVTAASSLGETSNYDSLILRQITADALGNADTSFADASPWSAGAATTNHATRFGVDLTAPVATLGGPADQSTYTVTSSGSAASPTANSAGNLTLSGVADNLSGPSVRPLVAQVRLSALTVNAAFSPAALEGKTYTNTGAAGTSSVAQSTADVSPCSIGRFNQSSSAAGTNALSVYNHFGVVVGYCTPVPYNLASFQFIPAAAAPDGAGGYYTTEVVVTDQAGNRSAPMTVTVLEDALNPTVDAVDAPASAPGAGTIAFTASLSDNTDILRAFAQAVYPDAGLTLQYAPVNLGTAFDNVLKRQSIAAPTVGPFIQHLQANNGTAAVQTSTSAISGKPSTFSIYATDAASRLSAASNVASSVVSIGTTGAGAFSADFNAGFALAASTGTLSNCISCNAAVTLTATARGATGTFANPFSIVQFWYQATAGGPWHLASSTSASSVADNGTVRSWSFGANWDPPSAAPLQPSGGAPVLRSVTVQVRAIGITSRGDAVVSPAVSIALTP